ncbi:hypothetical protein DL767_000517 [Monosporascus sp. MG133]|nr:hypothetical protein DL767_000517 [Monosporascus sp. MG133]
MLSERDIEAGRRPQPQRHDREFSQFSQLVQTISNQDAESRYREEVADNRIVAEDTPDSGSVQAAGEERTVISWKKNDPENPHNFSKYSRQLLTKHGHSSYRRGMGRHIRATTGTPNVLLPDRLCIRSNLLGATCAVAPSWPAILIFRFLAGAFASAPIAIVAGIIADVYGDPKTRGRAMAWFMATTVFGPLFAPIISGFCSATVGWRWAFWIALIYAGLSLIPLVFLPETYAPVLLTQRAAKIRKADPNARVYAAAELEPRDFKQLASVVLTRPLRMLMTELIVAATCLYLALVYAIFYMSFQAYSIIFQDVYSLSPGVTGLCFLPIDAYDLFAASANAAASSCRSVFAVVLPLATTRMFAQLGISGACSLLGGLSALMCIIPFIFFWEGERLRAGSKFCMALREKKLEMERNAEEEQEKSDRVEAGSNGGVVRSKEETV